MSEELDALRRRLYAPDVTAEEVERYRALTREDAPEPEHETVAAPATAPGPSRPRTLTAALAAGTVLALLVIGVAATSRPHPDPTPTPTPSGGTIPVESSFDDTTVPVPSSVRASFAAALRAGTSAGVLRYFSEHPGQIPAQIRTTTRADSNERFGSGTAMVFLSPSLEAQKGGRLTVAVTLDRAASVQLRAIRADSGMQSFIERIDDGARGRPGLPMVRTVVYDGEAPTVIELTVPKGVRWDVVAVFTD